MPFDNPPQPIPEVQVIHKAMALIWEPKQWCKGAYERRSGKDGTIVARCAVSALREVCSNGPVLSRVYAAMAEEVELPLVWRCIHRACRVFWSRPRYNRSKVMFFNDRRPTRHIHVLQLFSRTINRFEEARVKELV